MQKDKNLNLFKFLSWILKNINIAPIKVDNPASVDKVSGKMMLCIKSPINCMLFY